MMNMEKAQAYCKDKDIELRGELRLDPYIGWIDLSDSYATPGTGSYCQLCDLNIADGLCPGCTDDESCKL